MYVLVAKILFAFEGVKQESGKKSVKPASGDERFYRHLAAKIRSHQRVCAYIYDDAEQVVLAVTALAPRRDTLLRVYEQICVLCEREGLGRVVTDDEPLIAHIDSMS